MAGNFHDRESRFFQPLLPYTLLVEGNDGLSPTSLLQARSKTEELRLGAAPP